MDETKGRDEAKPEKAPQPKVPPDPEERAFTGHPDHPPATPDQSVDGNQELLRQSEDEPRPSGGGA